MPRLQLPTVTLCAVTSVNIAATVEALRASADQIEFAECLLLTDSVLATPDPIRRVAIPQLASAADYSDFLLKRLVEHVRTPHCLIVQWDGFVIDAGQWQNKFLDFDYIGAPWPQFRDAHDVGNGGFSLRSRRLMEACTSADFVASHPEDVAICRINRPMLESEHQIRFADSSTAKAFAFERADRHECFGFHGAFNLIPTVGADRFWQIYSSLDDRTTVFVDLVSIVRQLGSGKAAAKRRFRLIADYLRARCGF